MMRFSCYGLKNGPAQFPPSHPTDKRGVSSPPPVGAEEDQGGRTQDPGVQLGKQAPAPELFRGDPQATGQGCGGGRRPGPRTRGGREWAHPPADDGPHHLGDDRGGVWELKPPCQGEAGRGADGPRGGPADRQSPPIGHPREAVQSGEPEQHPAVLGCRAHGAWFPAVGEVCGCGGGAGWAAGPGHTRRSSVHSRGRRLLLQEDRHLHADPVCCRDSPPGAQSDGDAVARDDHPDPGQGGVALPRVAACDPLPALLPSSSPRGRQSAPQHCRDRDLLWEPLTYGCGGDDRDNENGGGEVDTTHWCATIGGGSASYVGQ